MSSLLGQTVSAGQIHVFGHICAAFFYLNVFVPIGNAIICNSSHRHFFAFSILFLIFLTAITFLFQAVFNPPWPDPILELAWMILASIPAFFLLHLRRKYALILGAVSMPAPTEKFDELKHEFLSVASHELRTPLAV
ncbi:MAG: hypothetical protein NC930_07265, partial [Candidatus Omnitrophica bacterium]|nr:hypothetical protein [Candidatus Omnitrophota bacterium]